MEASGKGTVDGITWPRGKVSDPSAFTYYPRLFRVREYVEGHYQDAISLAEIARIAELETTYFSKYFRCKTGVCFRDWLALLRVTKAQELFSERDRTVRQVAREVGFSSTRSFQRVFLKVSGVSPLAFKQRVRPHWR